MSEPDVQPGGHAGASKVTSANVIERGLGDVLAAYQSLTDGSVADYIPELATVDPDHFAIALGERARARPLGRRR